MGNQHRSDQNRVDCAQDIYFEAARRIGVAPESCRAYEDGESGLISAFKAGMQVFDVTTMACYPLPDGLKKAKSLQQATRTWHR